MIFCTRFHIVQNSIMSDLLEGVSEYVQHHLGDIWTSPGSKPASYYRLTVCSSD